MFYKKCKSAKIYLLQGHIWWGKDKFELLELSILLSIIDKTDNFLIFFVLHYKKVKILLPLLI